MDSPSFFFLFLFFVAARLPGQVSYFPLVPSVQPASDSVAKIFLSPRVNRPGLETYDPLTSNAEVKDEWRGVDIRPHTHISLWPAKG